jgi:thymidylate synthase (FAD)
MKVLDDVGYLELVESWGSDSAIIEAARMSTNKGFKGWGTPGNPGDEKLLKFLWTHKHMSPFEMAGATFEVKLPIFVAREWMRHRTLSFNELSARYSEMPDEHYVPKPERVRRQSATNKQGTGEEELDPLRVQEWLTELDSLQKRIFNHYKWGLGFGVSREVARILTPVSRYTKMRVSGNLRNWLHFLEQRLDESAQWEIREYAAGIHDLLFTKFPRTIDLFNGA